MPASTPSRREPDEQLLQRAKSLVADYLTLTGKTWTEKPHRIVEVKCSLCGRVWGKRMNELQRRRAGCQCQWADKYNRDPRAKVLKDRYHAMTQRCTPNTKTSKSHGDRGIKCLFKDSEHFIRWALANLPHPTYRGVTFDRIDGNGHYGPGNLRLADYTEQAMNTRRNVLVEYMGQTVVRDHLWHLVKTDRPDFPLSKDGLIRRLQLGKTVEEAITGPFKVQKSSTYLTPDPAIVSRYRAQ